MQTRRATCPCSRRSDFRWQSTPRPNWPPSPGDGDGMSSTGARPMVVRAHPPPRSHRPGGLTPPGTNQPGGTVRRTPVGGRTPMKALVVERNFPRFAASRVASVFGAGRGAGTGPMRLLDAEPPELPGDDWFHLATPVVGICGSDLATLTGAVPATSSTWSAFPFVPGHEVVGVLDDGGDRPRRATDWHRGPGRSSNRCWVAPPDISIRCAAAVRGDRPDCAATWPSATSNPVSRPGSVPDTGGGWSTAGLAAHASQLHAIPDTFSDAEA